MLALVGITTRRGRECVRSVATTGGGVRGVVGGVVRVLSN